MAEFQGKEKILEVKFKCRNRLAWVKDQITQIVQVLDDPTISGTDKLSGLNVADIVDITATQVDNEDTTETLTLFVSFKYDFEVPLIATIPLVFDSKTLVIREIAT